MSRGQVPRSVIRDPATAAAAGKCVMARWRSGAGARVASIPISSFHPKSCGFCEYPIEQLVVALDEFGEWAGLVEPLTMGEPHPLREEIERFLSLPRKDQRELVARRQGYAEEEDEGES